MPSLEWPPTTYSPLVYIYRELNLVVAYKHHALDLRRVYPLHLGCSACERGERKSLRLPHVKPITQELGSSMIQSMSKPGVNLFTMPQSLHKMY